MIKLLQALDSSKIKEIGTKTDALAKKIEAISEGQAFWKNLIHTLDVIIWPLAIILSLYLFRKQIKGMMDRFKSLKVTKDGAEFILDNELDNFAKEAGMAKSDNLLIGVGQSISKSGGDIIPKSGSDIIPKGSSDIIPKIDNKVTPKKSHAESPYQELLELKEAINQKLNSIANQNGINTSTSSNFAITSVLAEQEMISSDAAHKLKKLIELNNKALNASSNITHDQVSKMKRIFNNISI